MSAAKLSSDTPDNNYLLGGISAGLRVTWVGMAVNVALVVFKLWVGFVSRSQALIADGMHSLSDLFSDFVVIFGLKWGRKQEDEDHPYGHARIETISSMVVGLLLILVGLGIAYRAIQSIYTHQASIPSLFAIYAAATSIALKEGLFWYTYIVGKRLRSLVLIGNAWHHRSDALSSVAVLIGVGAVYVNPNWHLADSYAALVVTFFVVKIGINLVWGAFRELSDTAPGQEVLAQLAEKARQMEGVRQVHDMRARHSGAQIFVELHIVVDPGLTVREGHQIAKSVKRRLIVEFPDVTRVIIHVDPEPKRGE
ncbi:MAG TPA: cation diffusion facilitator family transporter [Acidobacteriota bacterium]|nr:cation diffusion facilitator family transporter [Acidobacteriota bacterium]